MEAVGRLFLYIEKAKRQLALRLTSPIMGDPVFPKRPTSQNPIYTAGILGTTINIERRKTPISDT